MKNIISLSLASMFLCACTQQGREVSQDHLLQATLWYQQSAEMAAIYYQCYHWAGRVLEDKLPQGDFNSPAVVLDIDETILDNSPQSARQVLCNMPFSDTMWDEWCSLAEARALPGALEFTSLAEALGVEVFYISNRGSHLMEVTLVNLRNAGFPYADSSHVLLKTGSSVKDERRARVASTHEILLLIGDNLGDFSGIYDERINGSARENVTREKDLFGERYIILPNPIYGAWEKPYRSSDVSVSLEMKKEALEAYVLQKE